ncbi:MAG: hypothetical protein AB1440_01220 [Pseudomonadota bacterium]
MKSYFLEELACEQQVLDYLSATLLGQSEPWVLPDGADGAIAYFDVVMLEGGDGLAIMTNVSGPHYEKGEEVLAILRVLRAELGGVIRDDFDAEIV